MKRVISIVGARPNFVKVAPIDRAFKAYSDRIEHMIVHTGQHYDHKMSEAFFQDLKMPKPVKFMGVGSGSHAEQTAKVMIEFEKICNELKPDLVIVVGDVNSTLACALTAVKMGIKVAHVEGGLRSFDKGMPEEVNRMATDAICDYCFVTEKSALEHLKREGFPMDRVYHVGNTMIDSQHYALPLTENCDVMNRFNLDNKGYVLITLHRPSNVDEKEQLKGLLEVFGKIPEDKKVVFPIHPRTLRNIDNFGLREMTFAIKNLLMIDPMGYIDFLTLLKNADFVMTDSGGIQEETTALGVPCLTVRTSTERPSTIEEGTNKLVNPDPESIKKAVEEQVNADRNRKYSVPKYWDGKAAERIAEKIAELIGA